MSGDMIDGRNSKINETLENYRYLYNKYHVYYGIGNHELKMDSKKYQDYIELLKETGAIVLDDDSTYIYNGKDKIRIFGIRYDEEMEDCNMSNDKKENCIKKLKEKKYRDINKEFVVEGIKLVAEAIQENADIKQIVICEDCKNITYLLHMIPKILKYMKN